MSDNSENYGQIIDDNQRYQNHSNEQPKENDNDNIQQQQQHQQQQHQDQAYDNSNEQQLLLSKTLQRPQQKQSSMSSHSQTNHIKTTITPYVKNQHKKINQDLQDLHSLEQQIQRLQVIKTQYKTQKQSIEKLGKVVQKLKSQNQQLKKGSVKNEQQREQLSVHNKNYNNLHNQVENQDQKATTTYNKNKQKQQQQQQQKQQQKQNQNSRVSFSSGNKVVGEFLNRQSSQKNLPSRNNFIASLKQKQINQRSPQYKKPSNTSQSFYPSRQYPFNTYQQYDSYLTPTITDHIVRNHVTNKHSIISNFVDELKLQLQQNEMVLQQQKRSHRQTRQKLQNCLQQLRLLHLRLQQDKNIDVIQRQCVRLKNQLQTEIQQRLLVEQRLRERQLMQVQNQTRKIQIYQQFDRELDRMDEIYFNLQATLKL